MIINPNIQFSKNIIFIIIFLLSIFTSKSQTWKQLADSLKDPIIEATYIQCGDSAEAFLIYADKTVYYSRGSQAFFYTMMEEQFTEVQSLDKKAKSFVNKENSDTCNMLAVVLKGPRYVLVNTLNTDPETRDIKLRLDLLKKDIREKMYHSIDKFNKRADEIDSTITQEATVKKDRIQKNLYLSIVAKQWICKGKVTIKALINNRGFSKRAFVSNVDSEAKCAPLLAIAALRSVNLSDFSVALNNEGNPISSWITVDVEFGK